MRKKQNPSANGNPRIIIRETNPPTAAPASASCCAPRSRRPQTIGWLRIEFATPAFYHGHMKNPPLWRGAERLISAHHLLVRSSNDHSEPVTRAIVVARPCYDADVTTTRRRRIVTRAVMALAGVVLLIVFWLTGVEPPEIIRSRALRLGMTEVEAVTVMGDTAFVKDGPPGNDLTLIRCFGESQGRALNFENSVRYRLGLPVREIPPEDWPVRVWFRYGKRGFDVYRIERGNEVEEAPQR
jgi:hypothetical protein